MTINTPTAPTVNLVAGETSEFTFSVTADAGVAPGTGALVTNDISGGVTNQYTAQKEFSIIIGFVPEYCESYATSDIDSEIQEVSFGSVVNNSANECGTYSDYTEDETLTDSFAVGTTNDISFYLGDCEEEYPYTKAGKVFIDWNYDGDFDDAGEMVFESPIFESTNGLAEGTFTVPTGISSGPKFMRIVVSENENDINPCGTYAYGETEDYKIYVFDPLGVADNNLEKIIVYPNPNEGTFKVDLRRFNTANDVIVQLFTINGQLVHQSKATRSLLEINTDQKSGIYFLRMTSGNQVINKKLIISK